MASNLLAAAPVRPVEGSRPAAALDVRDLRVTYHARSAQGQDVAALRGVSVSLSPGEALGVVGETGSGKTTLVRALMGLLPPARIEGEVALGGCPLPIRDEAAMRRVRWRHIALAFQGSASAFDPVYTVGAQVVEPLVEHLGLRHDAARERALRLWQRVELPRALFDRYPHQLSGGEKQRAMLAMALACEPEVLLVDEPTSGLDAATKAAILALLRSLVGEPASAVQPISLVMVSHDLADVRRVAQRTLVLYAGQAFELGPSAAVLGDPLHPYTRGLVGAFPLLDRARDLWGIRGEPPDPAALPGGCAFAPRCTQAVDRCWAVVPPLAPVHGRLVACHLGGVQTLLGAQHLRKRYHLGRGAWVDAVRDASLHVREGEVVALVGQTGCGKSSLARMIVGLLPPDGGSVVLHGQDLAALRGAEQVAARRRIQLVAQDPFDALSPRLTVLELVREPLDIQRAGTRADRDARVRAALRDVRLPTTADFLGTFAHALSGGQLQRVALARALVLEPKLLVADEPVSMLDASEQARIIRLLKDIQNERGLGLLLVSHDLPLVRKVADRIVVMHAGVTVEDGPADQVLGRPAHAATRALLRSFTRGGGADLVGEDQDP